MITGIYASNQGVVGERAGDFASAVLRIAPSGTALLLALTSGMGKTSAKDTIFHWFEDGHQSGRTGVAAGGTTTTITATDASIYVPNQVLLVEETGEIVLVNSINANDLLVTRGMAGTTVTSVTSAMHLQSIGNAYEEASTMPTAITQQGAPRLNYTQIFRNSWAVSGTATAVDFRTGNKVAKNKQDCAMYHAEDMERAMLWSRKHVGVRNGKPFRMTDGIVAQIEQYSGLVEAVTDGTTAGNYSRIRWEDYIRRLYSKNVKGQPNERIAIGGDLWLAAMNQMATLDGYMQISAGETVMGMMINKIQTPFGMLKLMTHPLMNESPYFQGELYMLHPGGIKRRMLRETREEGYDGNGRRINAVDADQGVLTTEMGIEVGAAQTMGILRGFKRAVASDQSQLG